MLKSHSARCSCSNMSTASRLKSLPTKQRNGQIMAVKIAFRGEQLQGTSKITPHRPTYFVLTNAQPVITIVISFYWHETTPRDHNKHLSPQNDTRNNLHRYRVTVTQFCQRSVLYTRDFRRHLPYFGKTCLMLASAYPHILIS